MSWISLSIRAGAAYAEALSDALLEQGALSVDLLDADAGTPDEQALFGEPGEPPHAVWRHNQVNALFPADTDVEAVFQACCAALQLDPPPAHSVRKLADDDWVRLTQSQFEPIRISGRLWIVPTWHEAVDPAAINIILDPGLAFGTGSHPTTRLCLRWLDAHIQGGETVLDYGCGSGILAIAALKLGATRAVGIDIDPQAVQASRNNAAVNHVPAEFHLPDNAPGDVQYDVVVANILTTPLRMLAPLLAQATRSGGRLVLSGILLEQGEEIRTRYAEWFDFEPEQEEEGWVCLSGIKRAGPHITRCPECGTRFRVTQEQLHAHQGMVRCGRCRAVFNALPVQEQATILPKAAQVPVVMGPDAGSGEKPTTALPSSEQETSGTENAAVFLDEIAARPEPRLSLPELPDGLGEGLMQEANVPETPSLSARRRWPWALGSATLGVALLLQASYFYRVELAAQLPGLKPALSAACEMLGCSVPLPQQEELLGIETSQMIQDPAQPQVIQLDFLLHNRAPYALAYPAIELTLLDLDERVVARRIFSPSDYLPRGSAVAEGLAGHRDAVIKLRLDTADLAPVGYKLFLFYPH